MREFRTLFWTVWLQFFHDEIDNTFILKFNKIINTKTSRSIFFTFLSLTSSPEMNSFEH